MGGSRQLKRPSVHKLKTWADIAPIIKFQSPSQTKSICYYDGATKR